MDTEHTAVAVMPLGCPRQSEVVTMTTPPARFASAPR